MNWEKVKSGEGYLTYIIPESWLFIHYYEALTVLFRIENALRLFVFIILKKEFGSEWKNINIDDEGQNTLEKIAKRRMSQAQNFGYIGFPVTSPLMHLTTGEIIRIITIESLWKHFKPYFRGSKEIIRNKLEEINSVRNSLAHFRPITEDDVELIKQNSKHVFMIINNFIPDILKCRQIVPTNTEDEWYKNLRTLGTDICTLSYYQSADSKWIRIRFHYTCSVLAKTRLGITLKQFRVTNLCTSLILREYSELLQYIIYLSEEIPYVAPRDDLDYVFSKDVYMLTHLEILKEHHEEFKQQIESMLIRITQETQLLEQDSLARGSLIEPEIVNDNQRGSIDTNLWSVDYSSLRDIIKEGDPPEYWGTLGVVSSDFITTTNSYPWMRKDISYLNIPF